MDDLRLDLPSEVLEHLRRGHFGDGALGGPGIAAVEAFLGVITTSGPDSEADFTGPQYWVRRQWPDPTLATGDALRVVDEPTPGIFETVPATNLFELPATSGGPATHLLQPGIVVLVLGVEMQKVEPGRQYILAVPVGPVVVSIGSPRTAGGEYDGHIMTGAATGVPPAGMSSGPACVVEYLPEAGGSLHQLAAGTYRAGSVIGVETDGTPIVAVDGGVPLGTAQYQVYQMTSGTTAGWDWVRAH